jgi:tricorn protease interacting factor F2/3
VIPVTIDLISDNNAVERIAVLMDEAENKIALPEDTAAYKLNTRHTGFFRTHYHDTENLKQLGKRIEDQTLPAEDRWGLENDLYALVKSGRRSLDDYLKFLLYFKNEDAYLPMASIASNLLSAFLTVIDDNKDRITALAIPWFEKSLDTIGYDPDEKEKHTISILRDKLIWDAGLYGSKKAADFAKDRFRSLMKGGAVHPDIMRSVMQVGALTGGDDAFDWLDQRFQSSQIEHDRMNILIALGCFKDADLIKKSLHYVLDTVAPRNKFIPVVAMASNPYAVPLLWEWYVSNLEKIEQFHPMLYERVIGAIIPASGMQYTDKVKVFFNNYMQKTDKAKDVIKLSLERLEINLRMRDAN